VTSGGIACVIAALATMLAVPSLRKLTSRDYHA
jgi:hypothetical protein